jgi:tetratricopeptide (TPR) repeat protein
MGRRLLVALFLVAATVAVYWQVTGHDFVEFDDPEYVRDNELVLRGLTEESMGWALTTTHYANWHPLTWWSYMADAQVFGRNPAGYHLTNLALHALNVVVLFLLLHAMTGAMWPSAFAAALLALHPIHAESVAWISERKDVLSMLFWLLTIAAYVGYVRRGGVARYGLMAALFALALMAKPMVVTLPFVLLLLDYWPLRRWMPDTSFLKRGATLLLEKLPLIAMSAASCALTYVAQLGGKPLEDGVWMTRPARLANAIVSYVRYLGKLFWPENLAALYPNPAQIGRPFWSSWQAAAAAAILIVISALAIVLCRKRPYFIVGWLWFVGTMIPVIGLIQIGRHSMADRYAYIPFIGLYVIVAWAGADLATRWRLRWVVATVAAVAIGICAILTFHQAAVWRDSITLFQHAANVTRDNWLMHNNLAGILKNQGRNDEAMAEVNKALAIYPESASLHSVLGELWFKKSEWFKAQEELEKAIALNANLASAHRNLGIVFSRRSQMDRAISELETAVRLDPDDVESRKALAITLASEGQIDRAIETLNQLIARQPQRTRELQELIATIQSQRRAPGSSR